MSYFDIECSLKSPIVVTALWETAFIHIVYHEAISAIMTAAKSTNLDDNLQIVSYFCVMCNQVDCTMQFFVHLK